MKLETYYYMPGYITTPSRVMMFVDGENLAIRYKAVLGDANPQPHLAYQENVLVWTKFANFPLHKYCDLKRTHYYTSVQGDTPRLSAVEEQLKAVGVHTPVVFKKEKGRRTKRVDIQLCVDMLGHAQRGNYDIAVLVAGDEDYVPLVDAVKREGKIVVLWFFKDGLSRALHLASDWAFDPSRFFFNTADYLTGRS